MTIDFGLTAHDYATYRAGFPASFFERLAALGIGQPGQQVVDLGTGTGTLARGFARRGCQVTGVDIAAALLDEALRLDQAAGVQISYRTAPAEQTGLLAACADVVTAGQCWHWFDRPRAAHEAARILRPDGHIVLAHFDWLPIGGNVVTVTEQLIEQCNPAWRMGGGTGLYPQWLRDLGDAGFVAIQTFSYDVVVPYTPAAWRGRIRASAGVGASLPPDAVAAFDSALDAALQARFPGEHLLIPHRVWAVLAQAPRVAVA